MRLEKDLGSDMGERMKVIRSYGVEEIEKNV